MKHGIPLLAIETALLRENSLLEAVGRYDKAWEEATPIEIEWFLALRDAISSEIKAAAIKLV